MLLKGRLKDTTLGDLLGTLHRAQATGRLALIDAKGQTHDILVRDGLVHEVSTPLGPRLGDLLADEARFSPEAARAQLRLGEFLLHQGKVTEQRLSEALLHLHLLKLDALFQLTDASIRFHVARPQTDDPAAPRALFKEEFLQGRPRRRGEGSTRLLPSRSEALRVLGLNEQASPNDIKQAFRLLAQRCHPDRHPEVNSMKKTELIVEFSQLTHAYHALLG